MAALLQKNLKLPESLPGRKSSQSGGNFGGRVRRDRISVEGILRKPGLVIHQGTRVSGSHSSFQSDSNRLLN